VPPAIECALQFTRRQPKPINRRAALHSLAARTPRHKHGRITYDYTQLALNPSALQERYRFYTDHFDLPKEGDAPP